MANVTIKIADEVLRKARVWAAQHGTNLSRYLSEQVELLAAREGEPIADALERNVASGRRRLGAKGKRPQPYRFDRESLYDRRR